MAFSDLTPAQQEQVKAFLRDYRAAMADTVRGLRKQELLKQNFDLSINELWAQINNGDLIPDGTGLSGADTTMTKADFTPKLAWSNNLLAAVFDAAGGVSGVTWANRETVTGYGVQLAGPNNV